MYLKAVHLILSTGPAGLIDLTKGSHQMFGGILPFVERIRFMFYTHALVLGHIWVQGTSGYPWLMLST